MTENIQLTSLPPQAHNSLLDVCRVYVLVEVLQRLTRHYNNHITSMQLLKIRMCNFRYLDWKVKKK